MARRTGTRIGHRARLGALGLLGGLALSISAVGGVAADAVYHSERLAFEPVLDAAGSGWVENIHPNGPKVFAAELYGLRAAEPNATYTIWLIIDSSELACDFESLAIPMAAALETNTAGNGTTPADFFFTPQGVPTCLRNASFPIHWEATLAGSLTHVTNPTAVTLD